MIRPAALSDLRRDVFAGIVVFLVAMPLCLGIANASGVEPFAGLLSGIIGGLVVALLSGSHLSVSGPAAGLVVIVVEGIAGVGSYPAFLMAVALAGVLQIVFGLAKAGRFAAYVPTAVVKGMLAAIGLLLVIKQLPQVAGLAGGALSPAACAVAVLSLAILLAWERPALRRFAFVRAVPAPLLVVVVGIAVTLGLDVLAPALAPPAQHRVDLPAIGSWAELKEAFEWPSLAQLGNPDVWRLAVTLAIVASLETLLSLEAVEQIDPARRAASPDVELRAQGVGNIVAGMLGALPLTAVIVRSSANVQAGARSRWSAFIHGALLLASVFALTAVINLIPLACLAAILIVTGFKLAKPSLVLAIARQGADRFVPFVATVAGVLATDLLTGILVGIAASVAIAIRANLQRPFTVARHDDQVLIAFRKDVSFLAKVALKRELHGVADGSEVIIDGSRADHIDPDVRELVDDFVAGAPARGIRVECRQLRRPGAPSFAVRLPWRRTATAPARA